LNSHRPLLYDHDVARLSFYLQREWLNLILVAVVIALIANCAMAPRGLRDLLALRAHRDRLDGRRESLRIVNTALDTEILRLRSDDRYLRTRIRLELGYVRPGELVYRFADANPPSGS
jgi:cell division protein FtsB